MPTPITLCQSATLCQVLSWAEEKEASLSPGVREDILGEG